ncbi:MAG: alcohol dehydrogenase catalytic domain-containing protein [Rhodobacteraceae bacterium]|nr:alcohol dehydrogenase catalytic domain-containing protein [Paracoccaceae bacterium]
MRAMVLAGPGWLKRADIERPVPAENEVLVRVSHAGICGTDLEIFRGGIPVAYPRVMGHEMIGQVVQTTSGEPATGNRVLVDPAYYCGDCYQCRAGQFNLCPSGGLIGRDRDGGFAEFLVAPTGNVYVLPDEIRGEEAPAIQVLTTCFHAQRLAGITPGQPVLVIGLGVTGQLHVQLAKAAGASPVIGTTRSAWKRELAETLGADATLAPSDRLSENIRELTGGVGPDLVIETSGRLSAFSQAVELVRSGGRIIPFGIYTETEGELPFYQLYFKELQLVNARAAVGADFPPSIELVRQGKIQLTPLISQVLPLGDLNRALDDLNSSMARTMKIILQH